MPTCDQGDNRIDTVRTFHGDQGHTFEDIGGTLTPVQYVGVGMSDRGRETYIIFYSPIPMQHTSVIIDGIVYVPQNSTQSIFLQLETANHGRPQCPDIAINEQESSRTKPQSWSHIVDGQECWYYNYEGAMAEAKHLNKRIPTIDEWMAMLSQLQGSATEKAAALGIPLEGFRGASVVKFFNVGKFAYLVSSSPSSNGDVLCTCLGRGFSEAYSSGGYQGHGFSLRFVSDNV